jgi:sRNA-binding regulator protein Hfq
MQQRGIKNIANTTLENFNTESKFDTILLLMNGIGLAGKIDNLQKFLLKLKSLLSEKGKIYLTSADIAYMFIEEDGSMEIDLNGGYYGEMEYETSFNGNIANYDWLYLNADILFMHAEEIGLKGEVISQTEEGDYLAVLSF